MPRCGSGWQTRETASPLYLRPPEKNLVSKVLVTNQFLLLFYLPYNQSLLYYFCFISFFNHYLKRFQDNCPRGKLPPPTPKLNLIQTLTLNGGGGQFSLGQLSDCPPTLKLALSLIQTSSLTEGQFSSGGNCSDTFKNVL